MDTPPSCSKCLQLVTHFLWLNCHHHICLRCARHLVLSPQYTCSNCHSITILNQQTFNILTNPPEQPPKEPQSKRVKKQKEKSKGILKVKHCKIQHDDTNNQDHFCLNCLQEVQLEHRKFHKSHRVISSSLCQLQVSHILSQQSNKLAKMNQKLTSQIDDLNKQMAKRTEHKQTFQGTVNQVFTQIFSRLQREKEKLLANIHNSMNLDSVSCTLQELEKQREEIVWAIEEMKIATGHRDVGFLKEQCQLIDRTRKITLQDVSPIHNPPTPCTKIDLHQDSIDKAISLITQAISVSSKTPFQQSYIGQRMKQNGYQSSLSYSSNWKKSKRGEPDDYFECLKSRVFTEKTMREDEDRVPGRWNLGEVSSSRFNSRVGYSHHMSVKDEINRVSREFREKSQSRRERQKEKTATIML